MLISSALVLMMTGPGLALFYCGLVRKKNVLSVMMQCIFLMCLMTVIWALYGFALSFGNDPAVVDKNDKPDLWFVVWLYWRRQILPLHEPRGAHVG